MSDAGRQENERWSIDWMLVVEKMDAARRESGRWSPREWTQVVAGKLISLVNER